MLTHASLGILLLAGLASAPIPTRRPNWHAQGNQVEASFGQSVASAGDVNGDGYLDVIVGAPYYDNGQSNEGRAFVHHGSSSGLAAHPSWTAEADQVGTYFGWSVASAGDVNGDGYADVIVGAYWYDNGQSNEGRAFVYHGSPSGLSTLPNWTAESGQVGGNLGYSVASAGDVNGDGYGDVVIGAVGIANGQADEGAAFTYHGSPSGLSAVPNWMAEGNHSGAFFGVSVASAGDVNGDGYADVIVGASGYDNGQGDEGRAFVYHGSAAGLSIKAAWRAESDQANAYFGQFVASAGDVNGDATATSSSGPPSTTTERRTRARRSSITARLLACRRDRIGRPRATRPAPTSATSPRPETRTEMATPTSSWGPISTTAAKRTRASR